MRGPLKIEGEGDAAIVYVTDALDWEREVERIERCHANVPATYAAAMVSATRQTTESAAFLDWLTRRRRRSKRSAQLAAPATGAEASPAP